MRQMTLGVRLADRAVFESFFPGPNAEAVSALRALAKSASGGVVFLYGPEGSGKSHLLQATCSAIAGSAYFPLGELVTLGAAALEGAGDLPAVCIDDLERGAGDAGWERALFRVYNDIVAQGAKLVFASREAPSGLPVLLPDLASRFAGSTVFQLRRLDETDQRRALQLRARQRGLLLPEDAVVYLQQRFPRDMRTQYELLDRLDAAALAAQRPITLRFAREVLGD
jgi:DnaA-homolog protein